MDPLERVLLARYEPRRLPAEVLLDALGQVTGVKQTFGNYPEGTTAKELVATIGSTYFLTTFGHPRRDTMEPRSQALPVPVLSFQSVAFCCVPGAEPPAACVFATVIGSERAVGGYPLRLEHLTHPTTRAARRSA